MVDIRNNFEGGTSGVTVTVANSGGVSGTALDLVNIGTGATCAYDNTRAHGGTLAVKMATGATAATTFIEWKTGVGTLTTMWGRAYIYMTANLLGQSRLFEARSATLVAGTVRIETTGKITAGGTTGTAVTTVAAVALNQWVRVEWKMIASATVGQVEIKLFNNADSVTPTETVTSAATLNTKATFDEYKFGPSASVATFGPAWLDDIGISPTGYMGPAVITYTETGGATSVGVASGPKTVTSAATYTETGGGGSVGVASGAKVRTSAAVYTETGSAAASGVASAAKVRTAATTYTETGGAAVAGVAAGPKAVGTSVYVKTGGGATAGVGSGPKVLAVHAVVAKTGGGVAAGLGSGAKALAGPVSSVKTGGAVAALAGVASRTITAAGVWAGSAAAMSGVWSNVSGAVGATAGDYASWTSTTPGDTAVLDLAGFGAGSVPPSAVVSAVDVTVRHHESDTTAISAVSAQLYIGSTPVGAVATLTKRVVDGDDVFTITGGITYADLPNLKVRLISTRA